MLFYSLPLDLISIILCDFCSLQEVALLDIAVCNHCQRSIFLDCLQYKIFNGSLDHMYGDSFTTWLFSRKIRIKNLICSYFDFSCVSARCLTDQNELDHLTFYQNKYFENDSICCLIDMFPKLRSIKLYNNKITKNESSEIVKQLSESCVHLEKVDLVGANVSLSNISMLFDSCKKLSSLTLMNCVIHSEDSADISISPVVSDSLKVLAIKNCCNSFHEVIASCKSLECLDLSDNKDEITDLSFIKLKEHISNLSDLNLAFSSITDSTLMLIGTICCKLKFIDLSFVDSITEVGLSALLKYCSSLEHLNISWCCSLTKDSFFKLLCVYYFRNLKGLSCCSSSISFTVEEVLFILQTCPDLQSFTYFNGIVDDHDDSIHNSSTDDDDFVSVNVVTFTKCTDESSMYYDIRKSIQYIRY